MAANIEYFIKQKYQEINFQDTLRTEELYKGYCSENPCFENILAIMHQEYNRLFSFMYSKLKFNAHYNANESRILLYYIKLYNDMISTLKNTKYSFEIREEYLQLIERCSTFLQESGGSDIPNDLPIIKLLDYEPIFMMCQRVSIPNRTEQASFPIKLIGGGSYAHVFKYKDDFYNKFFVIKRAKNNLNPKELQRFKKEYEVMKALHSPHVLEVYRYNDEKNEYYAEYADETLLDFIQHHPQLDSAKRKSIANQLFRGLSYIHILKGIGKTEERYQTVDELKAAFSEAFK